MNKQRTLHLMSSFYASSYIPIALWDNGEIITDFNNNYKQIIRKLCEKINATKDNPTLISNSSGIYGVIKIKDENSALIVGPYINKEINESFLNSVIYNASISWDEKENLRSFLNSIPEMTYHKFLNNIAFLYFILYGKEIDIIKQFGLSDPTFGEKIEKKIISTKNKASDHNTYLIEKEILDYVKAGDTEGLKSFFEAALKSVNFNAGKVASTRLRQEKNIFIGLVAIIGKIGAIEGGVTVEEAYRMIDLYTQECERLETIEEIYTLRYNCLLDFATRVRENKNNSTYSPVIKKAVEFIKTHTTSLIGVMDVVAFTETKRTTLLETFKTETGTTLGKAIMKAKLDESKRMLKYSEKSLYEISTSLCFSSQAYFQNTFKKEYGITPGEYRKKYKV